MLKNCNCKNWGILLIRLGLASVFLYHGINKLMDIQGTIGFFGGLGLPAFVAWLVAIVETVGGAAMLFGAFSFYAGILLSIVMLFAIILVKAKMGFGAFEFDLMLLLSSLGIAFIGAGKYSMHNKCDCGNCVMCKGSTCMHCKSGEGMKCDGCEMCKSGCTGHEGK